MRKKRDAKTPRTDLSTLTAHPFAQRDPLKPRLQRRGGHLPKDLANALEFIDQNLTSVLLSLGRENPDHTIAAVESARRWLKTAQAAAATIEHALIGRGR